MLDLTAEFNTKLAAERGFDVILEHPGKPGEPIIGSDGKALYITLLGGDASKLRAMSRRNLEKHIEAQRKGRAAGTLTGADGERELIEKLAAATLSWHPDIGMDGAALECTEANAAKLYADERVPWIAELLVKRFGDRASFFSSSSSSSSST